MEVDCGDFTFAVFFFFLFGQKRQRQEEVGVETQMSESPRGLLSIHTHKKQNGSVNKKAITNARLGHEAAGVAGVEMAPAFFREPWSFCGAMCHAQKLPIPKCTRNNKGGVESVRLFIWRGH